MSNIIKIYESLMESVEYTEDVILKGKELLSLIERDCQPYLDIVGDTVFYRGMRVDEKLGKKVVRKDRKPVDTLPIVDRAVNNLQEKLGFPKRSESLFVTADEYVASGYGLLYRVFPIGKCRLSYILGVFDLIDYVSLPVGIDNDEYLQTEGLTLEEIADYILNGEHDLSISDALRENIETMFVRLPQLIKEFTIVNDLSEYKDGEEVLIDCDEYYFIEADLYNFLTKEGN